MTPLYACCQNGHVEVAALLVLSRADPEVTVGDGGITPLLISCANDHVGCARALLSVGANADTPDAAGFTTPMGG